MEAATGWMDVAPDAAAAAGPSLLDAGVPILPAQQEHYEQDDYQQRCWHEFTQQHTCPALTYQQYLHLEYDEQPDGQDADVETSSSVDVQDYETASESDRPYTYARAEDGMEIEVSSASEGMDNGCPNVGEEKRNRKATYQLTQKSMIRKHKKQWQQLQPLKHS